MRPQPRETPPPPPAPLLDGTLTDKQREPDLSSTCLERCLSVHRHAGMRGCQAEAAWETLDPCP